MLNRLKQMDGLEQQQRRIVSAVAVAAVALLTLTASYNYVITDLLHGLNATETQTDMARQVPSIGALLVIFAAGVLGARLGARRVMLWSGVMYAIGSLIVAAAPVMGVATLGLLFASVGKSAVFVVGLAYMSARIADQDGRATAFAAFSAVTPITYVIMPLLTAVIVDHTSWRWVAVVWAVSGLVGTVVVGRLLPGEPGADGPTGELVTPILAGVMLAAIAQVITLVPDSGWSTRAVVSLATAVAALVALIAALRRMQNPSLSVAPLRHGGLVLLLIVLVLSLLADLWFYMTLGLQYIYGETTTQVAVIMIPAQLATIASAVLAGWLLQWRGITFTGTLLLGATGVALLASSLMTVQTPIWVAILIMCAYAGSAIGAGVALTNAIMNLAPPQESGSAASYRSAASNLGGALGVALMTGVVFGAAATSLQQQSAASDLDQTQVMAIAKDMRSGATSEQTASHFAVPIDDVDQIDDMQRNAYMAGFQAHGRLGGAVTLVAAVLFFLIRRRQESGVFAGAPDSEVGTGAP